MKIKRIKCDNAKQIQSAGKSLSQHNEQLSDGSRIKLSPFSSSVNLPVKQLPDIPLVLFQVPLLLDPPPH